MANKPEKEPTEEQLKKFAEELEKNLDYETNKPEYRDVVSTFETKYYFLTGLGLGALLGILGNFLATFSTEILKTSFPDQQTWIVANSIFLVIVIVPIVAFAWWIMRRLQREKETMWKAFFKTVSFALFRTEIMTDEKLKDMKKILTEIREKKNRT